MKPSTIKKAAAFFYPFFAQDAFVLFYGGEPLLAFDNLKYAVSLLRKKNKEGKKNLRFALTTNGSLVTEEMLQYFDRHRFRFMLSFDGHTQDETRQAGSLVPTRELIRRIRENTYPGIDFSTNSVFTPGTVKHLYQSLESIIEAGVPGVQLSLALDQPWDDAALSILEKEVERLTDFMVCRYKDNGVVPVTNFRDLQPRPRNKKKIICAGGRHRMALTPGERLWGCIVFHAYLKDRKADDDFFTYSFGELEDFIENHERIYPRVLANYNLLRQSCFFTESRSCFLCEDVDVCSICPVSIAHATSFIGKIPSWICRLKKVLRNASLRFQEKIGT